MFDIGIINFKKGFKGLEMKFILCFLENKICNELSDALSHEKDYVQLLIPVFKNIVCSQLNE